MMTNDVVIPDLIQVQISPELRDRWLKIGEGDDQIQGIKFEKFGGFYTLMVILPDGTGTPIEWPEPAVTFMEAIREKDAGRDD